MTKRLATKETEMTKREKRIKRQEKTLRKAEELIIKWSGKGYNTQQIIDGLWNWRALSTTRNGNIWTVQSGRQHDGTIMVMNFVIAS